MRNAEYSRKALQGKTGSQFRSNGVSQSALRELGHIAIDGCLPILKTSVGLSLEPGEAELRETDKWVGAGPQLVGQVQVADPVAGRMVVGIPLRMLQRNNDVYTELLAAAETGGSGLTRLEDAGARISELVGSLFDAITFGLGSVCGVSFDWEQGRSGIVLGPDELGYAEPPVMMHFPMRLAGTDHTYPLTLALEEPLANALAQLVLENDGSHETGTNEPRAAVAQSEKVTYRRAYFQELGDNSVKHDRGQIDLLMDVPLEVTVELGRTKRQVREVLELGPGSVIELDKLAGEPVDININGRLIARGEVVVVEENFGVRITDIVSPSDRLGPLG